MSARSAMLKGAVAVASAAAALRLWRRTDRPAQTSWSPPSGLMIDERLPARLVGDGEVTLTLLHGMFNAGSYWGAAYDTLAAFGAVLVPDLLGFGRAPKPRSGYTADAHADAVAETLRACGVDRPVVVGAHSIGSLVALRLAVRHPALVAAVVAFAPPLYPNRKAARRQISRMDPLARILVFNEALGERLCALMCRYPRAAAALVRLARPTLPPQLAEDRVRHSWASYRETLSNLVLSAEAAEWLAEIRVPVRVVIGARDNAVDDGAIRAAAEAQPAMTIRVVPDAGHDLPLTHPDVCLAELRAVLRQVGGNESGSTMAR